MNLALPLNRMTTVEKLRTMEVLWDDLCRRSDELPSPQWHREVLAERDGRLRTGREAVLDWDAAKAKIRRAVRRRSGSCSRPRKI